MKHLIATYCHCSVGQACLQSSQTSNNDAQMTDGNGASMATFIEKSNMKLCARQRNHGSFQSLLMVKDFALSG